MTGLLLGGVVMLVLIAAAATIGPRLGIAAPLLLVGAGLLGSVLPAVPELDIDPELVLQVLLPPLLYSSAVSMPAMNFRRDLRAISGLSVVLVVAGAVVLGLFFAAVIPGLSVWWGIALGAVLSPTDAVATSMVERGRVPPRVVAILDGESLLNDATALVLLRTAVAATAAAFSFGAALGSFVLAVAVATAVGAVVGRATLAVRSRIPDATVNTVLSFTVPFLASVPAELLGGSGLVAAVVAGLVTGYGAPRRLSPRNRLNDSINWRTVEVVLEGLVFLTMGLQLSGIVGEVHREHAGLGTAALIAVAALLLGLLVRAAYVGVLLFGLGRRARRSVAVQPRMLDFQRRLAAGAFEPRQLGARRAERLGTRVRRALSDIDYLRAQPLGVRQGFVVVWAGMRGAVTVAAAQTLPADAPHRSLLVFVAFAVATLSLLIQGGTIGPIARRILPETDPAEAEFERRELLELLRATELGVPHAGLSPKQHRLAVLDAQRAAVLDARDDGIFDADVLQHTLVTIDAEQLALDLRGGPD
ncbi:cation:proton antiporter [Nocardia sp. NPDC057353]|uniref:cation:proton antiporter n=1 Tax=Nocardia sp. NPDC057353 TaxID=3346104 RepID=UPI00362FEF05